MNNQSTLAGRPLASRLAKRTLTHSLAHAQKALHTLRSRGYTPFPIDFAITKRLAAICAFLADTAVA